MLPPSLAVSSLELSSAASVAGAAVSSLELSSSLPQAAVINASPATSPTTVRVDFFIFVLPLWSLVCWFAVVFGEPSRGSWTFGVSPFVVNDNKRPN